MHAAYQTLLLLLLLFCTSVQSTENAEIHLTRVEDDKLGIKAYYTGFHDYDFRDKPMSQKFLADAAKNLYKTKLHTIDSQSKRPSVLAALWTGGNRVYFATSVKGKFKAGADEFLKVNHPSLRAALEKCGEKYSKSGVDAVHNNDGRCGEIMVVAKWLSDNKKNHLPQTGKRIVAVEWKGGKMAVKPACAAGANVRQKGKPTFGCANFLSAMGFSKKEIINTEEQASDTTPLSKTASHKSTPPKSTKDKHAAPATKRVPKKPTPAPGKQKKSKPKPQGEKGRRGSTRKGRSPRPVSQMGARLGRKRT